MKIYILISFLDVFNTCVLYTTYTLYTCNQVISYDLKILFCRQYLDHSGRLLFFSSNKRQTHLLNTEYTYQQHSETPSKVDSTNDRVDMECDGILFGIVELREWTRICASATTNRKPKKLGLTLSIGFSFVARIEFLTCWRSTSW